MSFLRTVLPRAAFVLAMASPWHAVRAAPAPADQLSTGTVEKRGAMLVAGARGAVYELRGGAVVEFSAGAEFAFDPSLRLKLGKPGDPDTVARSVRLAHGRADVTIPVPVKEATAVLLRGSGKLSAVAKEGRSTFLADGERTSAAARAGEMLVGLGNEWKPLREGQARTLAPADPTAVPRAILGAPSVTAAQRLLFVRAGEPARAMVSWSADKDAVAYEVKLARLEGSTSVVGREVTQTTGAVFGSLTPGSYAISVAAVDRQGLPGASSAPTPLRVASMELPEGATVTADGAIVVGRDQRVRLIGVAGLELSYGASPVFVAAPDAIGLTRNEPTVARLRLPGDSGEATLRLEPRGLRAAVQILPRAARWPLDRVSVEVDLYDQSGRPLPATDEVDTVVTVNLTPVDVKWTRTGRKLRATVEPSGSPGPWVVRAEIKDRRGELLGRDFLEIAPANKQSADPVARR